MAADLTQGEWKPRLPSPRFLLDATCFYSSGSRIVQRDVVYSECPAPSHYVRWLYRCCRLVRCGTALTRNPPQPRRLKRRPIHVPPCPPRFPLSPVRPPFPIPCHCGACATALRTDQKKKTIEQNRLEKIAHHRQPQ